MAEHEGSAALNRTAIIYDSLMCFHRNETDRDFLERPERISRIWEALTSQGFVARCHRVQSRMATRDEVVAVHTEELFDEMQDTNDRSEAELYSVASKYSGNFFNQDTFRAAMCSTGSVIELAEYVLAGKCKNGIAIVRPPGHHSESSTCMGFCVFNNVAVATKAILEKHGVQRVLIVDWDVHHGNGTQKMFYNDKRVLYFSLHRYDNAKYYPCKEDANHTYVGGEGAEGFNVNVAWSGGPMGDAEYIAAFHHVLLPIAYEFNPELVIVSCGLDAARGDPICRYNVSPECYAHLTHLITGLANGKVAVALEGGYNLESMSSAMCACAGALLGDPLPRLELSTPNPRGIECIRNTIQSHAKYWKFLQPCGLANETSKN